MKSIPEINAWIAGMVTEDYGYQQISDALCDGEFCAGLEAQGWDQDDVENAYEIVLDIISEMRSCGIKGEI